jgi:hypothetical protein
MGIQNASKKWTMPIHNWSLTISQLAIFFEVRLDKESEPPAKPVVLTFYRIFSNMLPYAWD